jgi:hypothetical protein
LEDGETEFSGVGYYKKNEGLFPPLKIHILPLGIKLKPPPFSHNLFATSFLFLTLKKCRRVDV